MSQRHSLAFRVVAILVIGVAVRTTRGQGAAHWLPGAGMAGVNGTVSAMTVYDDGTGAALFVGGDFSIAGDVVASNVAKWNGTAWSALGSGVNARVFALTVFDPDGPGPLPPQLIVAGEFHIAGGVNADNIAAWDGSSWAPLGTGMNWDVDALASFDPDGAGPQPLQLIAGGGFTMAGGIAANCIARWDGAQWAPLGSGTNYTVSALLTTWDPDGTGPLPARLIVGGDFTTAGGISAQHIASWDGSAWAALGSGTTGKVCALGTFDPDGPGPLAARLIAGGEFTSAGGVSANHVASWDGSTWAPLGGGVDDDVRSLTTYDPDGEGPQSEQVIAGGGFTSAGGATAKYIASWNGAAWAPIGTGMNEAVLALSVLDPDASPPQVPRLAAGGYFSRHVAIWDGDAWTNPGCYAGVNSYVDALTTFDAGPDGPGFPELAVGGQFTIAGGSPAKRVACWDGTKWIALGIGMDSAVDALTSFDPDGAGPQPTQLIAGGWFFQADEQTAWRVAGWDGSGWFALGNGMNDYVAALTTWAPAGAAPQVVAGGNFMTAGDVDAAYIAGWDGVAWSQFGGGVGNPVWALMVVDLGGGLRLIAGGAFHLAGGTLVRHIAAWDGTAWSPFGSGLDGDVYALAVLDPDGDGPQPPLLYAGGLFTTAGGVSANRIACWDGVAWHPLGEGMNERVMALAAFDPDGPGPLPPQLIAGGRFTTAGGLDIPYLARWDGTTWASLRSGVNNWVRALSTFDPDGPGPQPTQLMVGGDFSLAGGGVSMWFARYGYEYWKGDLNCDGTADFGDINPFVLALTDPAAYAATYADCWIMNADINEDGTVDFGDINPFVTLLAGG